MSSKIFYCADVVAYGIFGIITTLEFLQHHFSQSGHGDLLMTRQLISRDLHPPIGHFTRSVCRADGFVQTGFPVSWVPVLIPRGLLGLQREIQKWIGLGTAELSVIEGAGAGASDATYQE